MVSFSAFLGKLTYAISLKAVEFSDEVSDENLCLVIIS
jgi:hypothetical protein